MPQSMWKRAILAAAAGLAVWAGLARARTPRRFTPVLRTRRARIPILRFLHVPLPAGCWASHNGYSCSSAQAECTFIFGSCRAFYGEPCLKGPPPPPWSPEADDPPRRATRTAAAGGRLSTGRPKTTTRPTATAREDARPRSDRIMSVTGPGDIGIAGDAP